jgi:hypothetical protein
VSLRRTIQVAELAAQVASLTAEREALEREADQMSRNMEEMARQLHIHEDEFKAQAQAGTPRGEGGLARIAVQTACVCESLARPGTCAAALARGRGICDMQGVRWAAARSA